jgi:nucleoside phosphorylase
MVILAGTAGTYTANLIVGETVIVESETIADLGRWSDGEFTPLFQVAYPAQVTSVAGFKTVRSYTTDTAGGVITSPVEAEIENMEGAAFLALCDKMGFPAMEVRTVSNRVGDTIDGRNMEIAIHRLALDLEKILARLMED